MRNSPSPAHLSPHRGVLDGGSCLWWRLSSVGGLVLWSGNAGVGMIAGAVALILLDWESIRSRSGPQDRRESNPEVLVEEKAVEGGSLNLGRRGGSRVDLDSSRGWKDGLVGPP